VAVVAGHLEVLMRHRTSVAVWGATVNREYR